MQCNIDKSGRVARAVWGVVMLLLGGAATASGLCEVWGGWWAVSVGVVLVLIGLFGLYEARRGWCVMRAMGFRTPM